MELIKKENHFQMLSKSVKEVETETGKWLVIEWYASTKDKDRYGDIVQPEAFEKAMNTYALNPILLLQHDADKPIGKVDSFAIDWNGLYIKAIVTEDTDWVMNKIKNGVLKWFSIWYRLLDYEMNYTEDDEWNITDCTCIIKELELLEISLVSIPANPYALRKSIDDCFSSKSMEMPEEEKIETPVEEEKVEEAVDENEQKENNDTDEAVSEWEDKIEEEVPNEEVETKEMSEEEHEKDEENNEEEIDGEDDTSDNADEQSEISDEKDEEAEKSDEKPDTEVKETPEEKSFEVIRKEFKEELKSKDAEIKAFAEKADNLEKKLSETIAVLWNVVEAMKWMHDTLQKTVVENSFQYNWPIVKDKSADAIEKAVRTMKSR